MTTMVVVVNLIGGREPGGLRALGKGDLRPSREGPSLDPGLASVLGGSLFTSDDVPPYRYVLTVDIGDLAQLGWDVEGEEMRGLLSERHRFAEVVQLISERFV